MVGNRLRSVGSGTVLRGNRFNFLLHGFQPILKLFRQSHATFKIGQALFYVKSSGFKLLGERFQLGKIIGE